MSQLSVVKLNLLLLHHGSRCAGSSRKLLAFVVVVAFFSKLAILRHGFLVSVCVCVYIYIILFIYL